MDLHKELTHLRRYLHRHPETSGKEVKTAAYLTKILQTLNPDQLMTGVGGTGILAFFDSGVPGPKLLFRTELDALWISAGEDTPALHNPDYDFPDKILPTGLSVFSGIVHRLLQ